MRALVQFTSISARKSRVNKLNSPVGMSQSWFTSILPPLSTEFLWSLLFRTTVFPVIALVDELVVVVEVDVVVLDSTGDVDATTSSVVDFRSCDVDSNLWLSISFALPLTTTDEDSEYVGGSSEQLFFFSDVLDTSSDGDESSAMC